MALNQIGADVAEKIEFVPADVSAMPFQDDSFDGRDARNVSCLPPRWRGHDRRSER